MTNRLVFGIDPGQTGAIAVLADGTPAGFVDMPTMPRKSSGFMIDGARLAAMVRGIIQQHAGAYMLAVFEQVQFMPSSVKGAQQSGSAAFKFGQGDGIVRGVFATLGIGSIDVQPVAWKRRLGLIGTEKDVARTLAIQRYPAVAGDLGRKKDIGRADALLIATWSELTQQVAERPAA